MEEKSILSTVIKNVAIVCGFMVAAILMFLGIMDYKKLFEQTKSPERYATATFFLAVFTLYFVAFVVFAIIQCVDAFKLIFASHKIAPVETMEPESQPEAHPRP